VEHPCYRCQAEIQEGAAFCPHCGAPQIRVIPPEQEQPAPPASSHDPSQEIVPQLQTESPPPTGWIQDGLVYPQTPGPIRWDLAWKGALLCGVGAAVLSSIPIISVGCCLWLLGAGALTVILYQKQVPGIPVTPGTGMRLGALAGAFGFLINAVVTTISFVSLRAKGDFRQAMQDQMQKQMSNNPDPKVQEMMQHMLDWVNTPQGAATLMVMVLVALAAVFLLITAAGGALGASMFGKRRELR
jgi:hypothetical protein